MKDFRKRKCNLRFHNQVLLSRNLISKKTKIFQLHPLPRPEQILTSLKSPKQETRPIRQFRESCLVQQVKRPLTFQWAKPMAQSDPTIFCTRSSTNITVFPLPRSKITKASNLNIFITVTITYQYFFYPWGGTRLSNLTTGCHLIGVSKDLQARQKPNLGFI